MKKKLLTALALLVFGLGFLLVFDEKGGDSLTMMALLKILGFGVMVASYRALIKIDPDFKDNKNTTV